MKTFTKLGVITAAGLIAASLLTIPAFAAGSDATPAASSKDAAGKATAKHPSASSTTKTEVKSTKHLPSSKKKTNDEEYKYRDQEVMNEKPYKE